MQIMNDSTSDKKSVLVVAPRQESMDFFQEVFEKEHYNLYTSTSFETFSTLVETIRPDLVILSLGFGDVDYVEATESIFRICPGAKIAFMPYEPIVQEFYVILPQTTVVNTLREAILDVLTEDITKN